MDRRSFSSRKKTRRGLRPVRALHASVDENLSADMPGEEARRQASLKMGRREAIYRPACASPKLLEAFMWRCPVRGFSKLKAFQLPKIMWGFTPVTLDNRFIRRIKISKGSPMFVEWSCKMTTYRAAYAEGKCLVACFHRHQTVHSAAACMEQAGSYVIAVENGSLRPLTRAEEKEFQTAINGDRNEPVETLSEKILIFRRPAWFKNS